MIYFDNAATTSLLPEVFEVMKPYFTEIYGNPNSKYYSQATLSRDAVEKSRIRIGELLNCRPDEVIFTSSATESNNFILKGISSKFKSGTIISTPLEHSSVSEVLSLLSKKFNVVFTKLYPDGRVDLENFKELFSLYNDVIITSVNFVNSDTGIIQDIQILSEISRLNNSLFHTDITQSVGKVPFSFKIYPDIDFISFSAHKFHGPKGIGAAICRKDKNGIKRKFDILIHGGEQEFGIRAGTLNTPAIVGMSEALNLAFLNLNRNISKLKLLDKHFKNILQGKSEISLINKKYHTIPGYYSLRIPGTNNEIFLKKISQFIAASTGSACSNSEPSKSLLSLGHSIDTVREIIRVTLDYKNEIDEIDQLMRLFS